MPSTTTWNGIAAWPPAEVACEGGTHPTVACWLNPSFVPGGVRDPAFLAVVAEARCTGWEETGWAALAVAWLDWESLEPHAATPSERKPPRTRAAIGVEFICLPPDRWPDLVTRPAPHASGVSLATPRIRETPDASCQEAGLPS